MTMFGNMMQEQLLISSILTHAETVNPRQTITSALRDGTLHRYSYADFAARARQLASGLRRNGVTPGARVGTLAWNSFRHLEIYYAASGIGAVCHTVNPRLHIEQVAFIIADAADDLVFYDSDFTPLVEALRPRCPSVRHWVELREADARADLSLYGAWLAEPEPDFAWPQFDERTASSLCYTSGTTGDPKGALYSHRSTLLHAYASCHPDALGVSRSDAVMLVVPMYHVNAWGLPYSALLSGAAIVMPGPNLRGEALYRLCEAAGVTLTAGVPTVWQGLLDHLDAHGASLSTLREIVIGGSACPASMIAAFAKRGIAVRHAWGMTENSPLGTVCRLLPEHAALDPQGQMSILTSQGRPLFGVQLKAIGEDGQTRPRDGVTPGHLMMRGFWTIERYFGKAESALEDGWFQTGDVASLDPDGYLRLLDRSKDVIKSGGEWISSIELENIAVAHPAIAVAACIAQPDDRWGERPLLILERRPGMAVEEAEIRALFVDRVARWAMPERIVFIETMPLTATGKIQKTALRDMGL